MLKGTCIAIAEGTKTRCRHPHPHAVFPDLCRQHGRILEGGRVLATVNGPLTLADRKNGSAGSSTPADRGASLPGGPGETPRLAAIGTRSIEVDEGPEAEPAARAAAAPAANLDALDRLAEDIWSDPVSRAAELETESADMDPELRERLQDAAPASSAGPSSSSSRTASAAALSGRWDKERTAAVLKLAELRFEADGKDTLSARELDAWAEGMAPVFDELFGRLNPENKYVAALLATGAVILPRYGGEMWEWARQLGGRRRLVVATPPPSSSEPAPASPPDLGGASWFERNARAAS